MIAETERRKSALRSTYGKYGAVADLLEVARLTCKAAHVEWDKAEEQLRRDGRATGMVWEEDAEAASEHAARSAQSYSKVGLPDGSKTVHETKPGKQFNLRFGRDIIRPALEGDLN
ncbi:hypothetical protein FS837_004557 [Tulasnella sp. UAMH 9824]|nr:hypothetical protein FS837_004557 [Tulasnella sp. UAMH 9824]